jgi:GH18 family chitinase
MAFLFMHPYKHSGRWQDVLDKHPAIYQTAYMDPGKKYHKTACTSFPEDVHLDVRNMSETL